MTAILTNLIKRLTSGAVGQPYTTVGGSAALVVLLQQLIAVIDGDPATEFEFKTCMLAIGMLWGAMFAKDAEPAPSPEPTPEPTPVPESV